MLAVYSRDYQYVATEIDFELYQVENCIAEINSVSKHHTIIHNSV